MNVAEALHCAGCGHELSPYVAAIVAQGSCPECRTPMDLVPQGPRKLLDCSRCGGQFIAHPHLRALLEQHEALAGVLPGRVKARNPLEQKLVYRHCPTCSALMHRRNFGGASGVIVDICGLHGTFFDAGELPAVLAFVERGGLERERAAAKEAARKERFSIELDRVYVPVDEAPLDFGAAAEALLTFIIELIERVRPSRDARKKPPPRA
jgi:Zn-finger nucleic acid-binding protein